MVDESGVSKKLISNLVILVVVLTFLSVIFTYASIKDLDMVNTEASNSGKVSINIQEPPESMIANGQVGITIINDNENQENQTRGLENE